MNDLQDTDWKDKESNEDLNIPRAAINKFMKEIIPDVRVSNETREVILQCCNEFIHIVTSQANSICDEQQKKTLSSEHILAVFDKLGWSEYKEAAEIVENDCKEKRRRQSTKLEHTGIPEEELLKQQQELINQAKLEQAKREQEEWSQVQIAINFQFYQQHTQQQQQQKTQQQQTQQQPQQQQQPTPQPPPPEPPKQEVAQEEPMAHPE